MSDEQQIREVIQTYFDSMYQSDGDKARQAFHPDARITGYTKDGLQQMCIETFAGFVESISPSPRDKGKEAVLEVLSLDIAGDTAVARVRDHYIGNSYLDTLSFIKTEGRWRIYSKLFHIEAKLATA